MHFKLIAINGRYIHSCLALYYVRSELLHYLPTCKPEIMQFSLNDPYYPTLRRIGSGEPAALFFSVYIWNSLYIQRLIGDVVKILPTTPVILGGPQAAELVESLAPEVMEHCSMVYGEIEGVDKSLYEDLDGHKLQKKYTCQKVPNFCSPYTDEDFADSLQNRHIYYESSRGCPFGCTYCLSASEKGVRHLPASQVYAEIKNILAHQPKIIRFVDRTFNDMPERALDIWRFLADQPGKTLFHFEMAPDRFTPEMFRFLEKVSPGRFQFEIGVQSTNPQTLEAINRKCDLQKLAANINKLVSLDTIHIHLDLILGLPYETGESFARSFADVFKLGPHYIQMGLLKILPDTAIRHCVEKYGLLVCEKPPYEVLANNWLNAKEIENLFWFGECVEAFYNNRYFRNFWNYLRQTGEDIFSFFEKLLVICQKKRFFELSHTQELMSSLLHEHVQERPDKKLLKELLIFDWLSCGHHFLPDHLFKEPLPLQKKTLWKRMPQNWEGVYDYKSRDEFFKQGVFIKFSTDFFKEAGLSEEGQISYVCFTPERENTIFKHNKIVMIPEAILGI